MPRLSSGAVTHMKTHSKYQPVKLSASVQLSVIFLTLASSPSYADTAEVSAALDIPVVEVEGVRAHSVPLSGKEISERDIKTRSSTTLDTTRLLEDIPGLTVNEAGAISALPAIHGLADERLKIQVDGMDLSAACPNHMNSILSYINPVKVGSVKAFTGITPVSEGGDSIGGTIQVSSLSPVFAEVGKQLINGSVGTFYRSNGYAHGWNASAGFATDQLSFQYSESHLSSSNYRAAKNFKDASTWAPVLRNGLEKTDLDEVGSSSISGSVNKSLDMAFKRDGHLFQLGISQQSVGFEGFPNQRMDMTNNENTSFNFRYTGLFDWGDLNLKLFRQRVKHAMDMSYERSYAMPAMPMLSESQTEGGSLTASLPFWNDHLFKVGGDFKLYELDDWWPPVQGMGPGSMCCDNFWNVRNGKRDRVGVFAEVDSNWTETWVTSLGLRTDIINADAGKVQGYSPGVYQTDANAFNAKAQGRRDQNYDWTALARYTPDRTQSYEFGLARKSRSPSVYELYPWSSFTMAALMNNFAGDGNAYIGNSSLEPEVAHTASFSLDWHDENRSMWGTKASVYLTYVQDYINAVRCTLASCGTANTTRTDGFVTLQYANQSARLYGMDFSAYRVLVTDGQFGQWTAKSMVGYVRGEDTSTGDNLYHIMPLNGRFTLEHKLGGWTSQAEVQMVSAKTHVSAIRNETETDGYGLLNLRTSYSNKFMKVDLSLENALNKLYYSPLGGAYLGQGFSMTSGIIPWGINVPGMGRSANVAVTFLY